MRRATAGAVVVALMTMACVSLASATYEPSGSPVLSIGDTFAIYSAYHQSFCYWKGLDSQMIYDWENIKCNVGTNDLAQASRFLMAAPYARQICGRIPMSPYNISVSFAARRLMCGQPDRAYACNIRYVAGAGSLINCGINDGNDPVRSSYLLANTAVPPSGADGWLHGGETPVSITSVFTGAKCGVDSNLGKILCPGPGPAAASVFYLIPVDPAPTNEC